MTIRDRARTAAAEAYLPNLSLDAREQLIDRIEQAITAAVEAEREACAKIADAQTSERLTQSNTAKSNGHDEIGRGYQDLGAQCKLIADAIRARSTASPP